MNKTELKSLNETALERMKGLSVRDQARVAQDILMETSGFAEPTRVVALTFVFENDKNSNGRIQVSLSVTPQISDGEFTSSWPIINALLRIKRALEETGDIDDPQGAAPPAGTTVH